MFRTKPSFTMDFPQSQALYLSWIDKFYKNFHWKSMLQFKTCLNFHQELLKCDIEKKKSQQSISETGFK